MPSPVSPVRSRTRALQSGVIEQVRLRRLKRIPKATRQLHDTKALWEEEQRVQQLQRKHEAEKCRRMDQRRQELQTACAQERQVSLAKLSGSWRCHEMVEQVRMEQKRWQQQQRQQQQSQQQHNEQHEKLFSDQSSAVQEETLELPRLSLGRRVARSLVALPKRIVEGRILPALVHTFGNSKSDSLLDTPCQHDPITVPPPSGSAIFFLGSASSKKSQPTVSGGSEFGLATSVSTRRIPRLRGKQPSSSPSLASASLAPLASPPTPTRTSRTPFAEGVIAGNVGRRPLLPAVSKEASKSMLRPELPVLLMKEAPTPSLGQLAPFGWLPAPGSQASLEASCPIGHRAVQAGALPQPLLSQGHQQHQDQQQGHHDRHRGQHEQQQEAQQRQQEQAQDQQLQQPQLEQEHVIDQENQYHPQARQQQQQQQHQQQPEENLQQKLPLAQMSEFQQAQFDGHTFLFSFSNRLQRHLDEQLAQQEAAYAAQFELLAKAIKLVGCHRSAIVPGHVAASSPERVSEATKTPSSCIAAELPESTACSPRLLVRCEEPSRLKSSGALRPVPISRDPRTHLLDVRISI
eukprot:TRINITY_DN8355_c0_g1_i4.p1 TRINITY_DN8355_c0_g1~~TRINITY_DN8355_c0_g1_i4.p1  ORF type:complete len:615 (+),score=152.85 TRINITY_DN8355_c0_g1_i4:119-1846(+)